MMYYMDNFKTANSLDYRLWKNRKLFKDRSSRKRAKKIEEIFFHRMSLNNLGKGLYTIEPSSNKNTCTCAR